MRKTLENGLNNKNLTFMSAGTMLVIVFLAVVSYRKYMDAKKNLEETLEELELIKKSMNENNTKVNLVMNRMNQKIEEIQSSMENKKQTQDFNRSNLNEIDSAVHNLLG